MAKVLVVVPKKGECISELKFFLKKEAADLYIFPEGFLYSDVLVEALDIIKEHKSYVITGYKDYSNQMIQEKVLVIDSGTIADEYTKCILTSSEKGKGKVAGEKIHCVQTKFGKIGVPICYEIHFPEVARIMCLENPVLLINLIGTGMYHELQYGQWNALARARAIENEVYILGCSHYVGEIPIAFGYSNSGETIFEKKNEYGTYMIEIDFEKSNYKAINYSKDRVTEVFKEICEPR